MKLHYLVATVAALFLPSFVLAQNTPPPKCQELIALYLELAERSGETVSEAEARAEVMSESLTNQDCAAMLSLFPSTGDK